MRIIIYLLLIVLSVPAVGQRKPRTDEEIAPGSSSGVIYSLPRSAINISVKAVRAKFEPGPYVNYAAPLLGITNARTEPYVHWRITDISFVTVAEPDPEQVYKAMGPMGYFLSLTSDGRLEGIGTERRWSREQKVKTSTFLNDEPEGDPFFFSRFNDSPIIAPGDSTNNYRPVRISSERKAAEAAERILECRQTRYHMAAGLMDEFHPDGESYRVSLDELDEMESGYMSLFVGHTTYYEEEYSFYYVPVKLSDRGDVVFRFSEESGVVPADDLSGKPVTAKIEPNKDLVSKYLSLTGSKGEFESSNLYYRIPARGEVKLLYDMNTIASAQMILPQFGKTAAVPEELLTGDYAVEIDSGTGMIKMVVKK